MHRTQPEGREIWHLTITNSATGPAHEKPAFWADASIHATELAPTVASLHLLHTLATGYGIDPEITRCLDTRAFYLVPRVNPDGAELALAGSPRNVRSSTRAYPADAVTPHGHDGGDVDGDGHLRVMRTGRGRSALTNHDCSSDASRLRLEANTSGSSLRAESTGMTASRLASLHLAKGWI